MKIELDLSIVCIETATKRAYNQSLSRYFKADTAEKEILEAKIECLVHFIENADFQKLRNSHPVLRGGVSTNCYLQQSSTGHYVVNCDNKPVATISFPK